MKKLFCLVLCLLTAPALAEESVPGSTTIDAAGNMQFVVKGETALRLAPQDGLCNNASKGAIRFNATTESFEGCNGKGTWKKLGGDSATPVGTIIWYAGTSCPDSYVAAVGSVLSGPETTALAAVLGTTYGAYGQLPDLRGVFIRGLDGGRNQDPLGLARAQGSYQADSLGSHYHNLWAYTLNTTGGGGAAAVIDGRQDLSANPGIQKYQTLYSGSTETRPKNIAMLPCIKY